MLGDSGAVVFPSVHDLVPASQLFTVVLERVRGATNWAKARPFIGLALVCQPLFASGAWRTELHQWSHLQMSRSTSRVVLPAEK